MTPQPARPLVGLTAYTSPARWAVWDTDAHVLHQSYADCVVAAGGVPVIVPPYAELATDVVVRLDALVVTGGPDVEPRRYGAEPHPLTGTAQPARDEAELALLTHALNRGLPVLAICRGMQLLTALAGGSLSQHLPDVVGNDEHQAGPGTFGRHGVEASPGSRLAAAVGTAPIDVASHHHQGIDSVGAGLRAVGWAPDGSVEAVERDGDPFVLGVLWHPEESGDTRLFSALVNAARGRGAQA